MAKDDDQGKGGNGGTDAGAGDDQDKAKLQEALRKERAERAAERAKLADLQAKADKLDELEGASKSEQTKAAERIAELERKLQEGELRAARLEAAAAAGLPFSSAKRLVGTTPEELAEDAKALAEELGVGSGDGAGDKGDKGKGDQGRQREDGRQQATSGDADAGGGGPELDMNERIRAAARR